MYSIHMPTRWRLNRTWTRHILFSGTSQWNETHRRMKCTEIKSLGLNWSSVLERSSRILLSMLCTAHSCIHLCGPRLAAALTWRRDAEALYSAWTIGQSAREADESKTYMYHCRPLRWWSEKDSDTWQKRLGTWMEGDKRCILYSKEKLLVRTCI